MKRCPECGRDYDTSMSFCLDDGAELLYGPSTPEPSASSGRQFVDEPQTAILHETAPPGQATRTPAERTEQAAVLRSGVAGPTEHNRNKRLFFVSLVLAVVTLVGFFGYLYVTQARQIESIAVMPFVNE